MSPANFSADRTPGSPFRLDGTVTEILGEISHVEPEVADRELEQFEALKEWQRKEMGAQNLENAEDSEGSGSFEDFDHAPVTLRLAERFPSGKSLLVSTGRTDEGEDHWDPVGAELPLLDTGPAVRELDLSDHFTVGEATFRESKAHPETLDEFVHPELRTYAIEPESELSSFETESEDGALDSEDETTTSEAEPGQGRGEGVAQFEALGAYAVLAEAVSSEASTESSITPESHAPFESRDAGGREAFEDAAWPTAAAEVSVSIRPPDPAAERCKQAWFTKIRKLNGDIREALDIEDQLTWADAFERVQRAIDLGERDANLLTNFAFFATSASWAGYCPIKRGDVQAAGAWVALQKEVLARMGGLNTPVTQVGPVGWVRPRENRPAFYAGSSGAGAPPAATKGGGPATSQVGATKASIRVSVNAASKIELAPFVDLLNATAGIAPEFKNKIKQDKNANAIVIPDYSHNKVIPGKEWLFDLGRAADDWEVTTATLFLGLDADSFIKLEEDIGIDEERGHPWSDDPNHPLIRPSRDFTNPIRRGLMLGLTIPTSAMVAKNPPPPDILRKPQIVRLKSGKGLIIIARQIVIGKRQKVVTEVVPVPKKMIAMTFFHELSAHACFFRLGQDAAHGAPLVNRNVKQAEESYRKVMGKEQDALEKKLKTLINAMNKQVP